MGIPGKGSTILASNQAADMGKTPSSETTMTKVLFLCLFLVCLAPVWPKKSVLDYNEADVERIYREWAENDPDEDEDDDDMPRPGSPPKGQYNHR